MDGGVIADIATIIIFTFFYLYLYSKLGKSTLSYVVLVFTSGVMIVAISDIISLLYPNMPYVECISGKFTAMGALIAIVGLLHIATIFPRKSRLRTLLPSIYFISAIQIIYLFFTPHLLFCDPLLGGVRNNLWSIYALWTYSLLIFASLIPIYHLLTSRIKIEKIATFYMTISFIILIAYIGIAQIIPIYYEDFEVFSAVHVLPIIGLLYTIALVKYGIYIIVPNKEMHKKSENLPKIKYGDINGIYNIDTAYKIFRRETSKHPGIIVTIRPPQIIKQRYSLKRTPILWLTYFPDGYDRSTVPDRLHFEAVYSIANFLDEGGEIVMIDGVEYIIKNYGRRFFAEFLDEIKAVKNDVTIILGTNLPEHIEGLADYMIKMESSIKNPRIIVVRDISNVKNEDLLIITLKSKNRLKSEEYDNAEIIAISNEFDFDRLLFEGINKIEDSLKRNVYIECMDYIISMGKEKDVMNLLKDIIDIVIPRDGYVFIKYTPRIWEKPSIAQFIEDTKL